MPDRLYVDTLPIITDYFRSVLTILQEWGNLKIYEQFANENSKREWVVVKTRSGKPSSLQFVTHETESFNIQIQMFGEILCRQKAFLIYNTVREKCNFEIEVDTSPSRFPATRPGIPPDKIQVVRLSPIAAPYSLGNIGQGLFQYSINYELYGRFIYANSSNSG